MASESASGYLESHSFASRAAAKGLSKRRACQCQASEGYALTVDLATQTVTRPDGVQYGFEVDAFRKHCLLNGLDDIGLTLQDADAIKAFEEKHKQASPWLFGAIK